MRIDSTVGASTEWTVPSVEGPTQPTSEFSGYLARQLSSLDRLQSDAAAAATDLAAGVTDDVAGAVDAVERARLSMQLASQLRTKGVEAIQNLLSTPV